MADRFEAFAGSPWGVALFCAWVIFVPMLSVDTANYGLSVYTAFVLVVTIGSVRRDRLAVHVKLDDLECAVDAADSSNKRLEELTEQEIESKRGE